jgi:4-hydroxybenzoate polyprenyltransferase
MPLPVKLSDSLKSNDRGRRFAWLQLLRLPNVFTAVADVAMGYLVTHGNLQPPNQFAMLVAASCLLYLSGMVLNDVFDADEDAREQPMRPIPSGRISLRAATLVGWAMLASGLLMGWVASVTTRDLRPGIIATLLAACIVLYDRVVKRTPVAPLVMGACRALNVLLGMSLAPLAAEAASPKVEWGTRAGWMIAAGMGVYIVGVTVFSRTDARTSSRGHLIAGLAVLLAAMSILATVPVFTNNRPPLVVVQNGWFLLWILLALITGRRCVAAIIDPSPLRVQTAVRHCVHSIIVLDAAVCVGYASPFWGFAVLSLIFPTVALAAWLRAT